MADPGAELSWFQKYDNFMNTGAVGGTIGALNSIGQLWGAYNAHKVGKAQINNMKEQLGLMKEQMKTENERYDKREAERLNANKGIGDSASLYELPSLDNNQQQQKQQEDSSGLTQELPTERV